MKTKITISLFVASLFVTRIVNAQTTANSNAYNSSYYVGWSTAGGDLPFKINGTTHMTLQNTTGNFGIGTTSPNAPLEVKSSARVSYTSSSGGTLILSGNSDGSTTINANAYTGTPLLKFTQSSGAVTMAIDNSGNVGIGTTAPISRLSVYDAANVYSIAAGGSGGTNIVALGNRSGAASINAYTANFSSTQTLALNPDGGNVGIGTTTPGAKLEIAGQLKITGGTPGLGKVLTSDANGLSTWATPATGTLTSVTGSGNIASSGGATPNITFTGILPLANGGSNANLTPVNGGAVYSTASALATTAAGTSGQVLTSNGAGAPTWATLSAWKLLGNAGTVDGTNFIGTTDNVPFNIRVNNQKAGRIESDDQTANLFLGYQAGNTNTGYSNTGIGYHALLALTNGFENTATGNLALWYNTYGCRNSALGYGALIFNTTGNDNSAVGIGALNWNTDGEFNTGMGGSTIANNTTGDYNTALGYFAYGGSGAVTTYSNSMALGANAYAITASNMITVGDANITYAGCKVGWTTISDARVKKDVKENVPGLAFIKELRPVTYYYDRNKENELLGKKDTAYWEGKYDIDKIQFSGFLAQEVDAAAKKIGYDFSGVSKTSSLWGLKYAELTVPLVKAVQEQQEMIESLKSDNTTLKKQMAQLVSMVNDCCNHPMESSINSPSQTSIKQTDVKLTDAQTIVLEQNSPNPFSEQTTINYSLPDNTVKAQMLFYNSQGKLIQSTELTQKGKGTLNVFASDLSSGIYTYTLVVDGKVIETRKMIKQ